MESTLNGDPSIIPFLYSFDGEYFPLFVQE